MKISTQLHIRSKPPWRILFFGTDEFSVPTLQALNENRGDITEQETTKIRMFAANNSRLVETLHVVHPEVKKPTPVLKYAAMYDLSGYSWPLKNLPPTGHCYDVGVLASFGHLIPAALIKKFPYGILNVHPSLLPRWRGAAPLHHTLLNADSTTGVSIMVLQPKVFDRGPLLAQTKMEVPLQCSQVGLRDILSQRGAKLMLQVLNDLPAMLDRSVGQSKNGICYAHKIGINMSYIDWENQTVSEIDCQYRALHHTTELRSEWQGITIRLLDMLDIRHQPDVKTDQNIVPGIPVYNKADGSLWVRCKDGWVGFQHVVIKKKMTAKAFYNGYLSKQHHKGIPFMSRENGLFGQSYTDWITKARLS